MQRATGASDAEYRTAKGEEIETAIKNKFLELGLNQVLGVAPQDYDRTANTDGSVAWLYATEVMPSIGYNWWETLADGTTTTEEPFFMFSSSSFRSFCHSFFVRIPFISHFLLFILFIR